MPDNLSPYQGEPTPEKNKLWEDLYVGKEQLNPSKKTLLTSLGVGASRVTKYEAEKMINKTYELPDTDGDHVVTIEVFHQLHCLVRLIVYIHGFCSYLL
jgi:hypothetical protein